MHFTTTLLVLSGATAALAGSFAAPAAPAAHLALRQASRDQVVRRQHMQKMRRQAEPSAVLNRCGAQSQFVLRLSDIAAATDDTATNDELNALNTQYVAVNVDQQALTATPSLLDATNFNLNDGTCAFEANELQRFSTVDASSPATYQTIYFPNLEEDASAQADGFQSVPLTCQISGNFFQCSSETADGTTLNTFLICNDASNNNQKFLGVKTVDGPAVDGCTGVTIRASRD